MTGRIAEIRAEIARGRRTFGLPDVVVLLNEIDRLRRGTVPGEGLVGEGAAAIDDVPLPFDGDALDGYI